MNIVHGKASGYAYGCRCELCRFASNVGYREWRRKYPERARAKDRRRATRPGKDTHGRVRARHWIENEIKRGRLKRPDSCEECGENPGRGHLGQSLIFAHIPDPAFPEDHQWLCSDCSGQRRWKEAP